MATLGVPVAGTLTGANASTAFMEETRATRAREEDATLSFIATGIYLACCFSEEVVNESRSIFFLAFLKI